MVATSNDELSGKDIFRSQAVSILLILAILVAGFLGWVYWNRFQELFVLQAEINKLQDERVELKNEISSLRKTVNRRNELDYIEKLAKDELGLVYPKSKNSQTDS